MRDLKDRVVSGLIWRLLERAGVQLSGFVVSVILARLLLPSDFGTVTLVTVFTAVAAVFVNGGFAIALVQKKDVSETELNSIFYFSLAVALGAYGVLFAGAPWVARFYQLPVLVWILRLCALGLVLGALNSVQNALLSRTMKFKLSFQATVISTVVSSIVGIGMAVGGCGLWSLVGLTLTAQAANVCALWAVVGWRPRAIFSLAAVRNLFGFGSRVLAASVLDTVFVNLYNLIIGKLFNPTMLGYYSRGQSVPNMAMNSVQGAIDSVFFPALASCQHDIDRVRSMVRRAMCTASFLIFPIMFGLAAVAKPLVQVLLTDKWLPCVPYLQLSCVVFAFWPIHIANLQAIVALGRSDISLLLEIIKKLLVVAIILATVRLGVLAMVAGQAVGSALCVVINSWPNRRLIRYPLWHQAQDILPAFLLAAFMGGATWGLSCWIRQPALLLGVQLLAGAAIYLGGAALFRLEAGRYVWNTAGEWLGRRREVHAAGA
jgi:O-antigen/teichoic acid export membrane protein